MNFSFKTQCVQSCLSHVEAAIDRLQSQQAAVIEARNLETKSTAGDKHETGRAMMQWEEEKLSQQATVLSLQRKILHLLQDTQQATHDTVGQGSLILAQGKYFLLAVGLGKIKVAEQDLYVVSPDAPVGAAMLHAKKGDTVIVQGKPWLIEGIW